MNKIRNLTFILIYGLFLANIATAQNSSPLLPPTIQLDSRSYTKEELNSAFTNAVFTENTLLQKSGLFYPLSLQYETKNNFSKNNLLYGPRLKAEYPWLYPFIYPDAGLPQTLSVNKWTKPIKIAFGMPSASEKYKDAEGNSSSFYFNINGEDKNFSLSEDRKNAFTNFLDDLSKTSGLSINLSESQNDPSGNVRIVFVKKAHFGKSFYKLDKDSNVGRVTFAEGQVPVDLRGRDGAERKIKNGIPFTTGEPSQVDGYFLTNEKNEIQMAFCYISDEHEEKLQDALIHECTIRSLGFPDSITPSVIAPSSYLALWNEPEKWEPKYQTLVKPPENLAEFDRYMIKLLYNPALIPGTSYSQSQKLLMGF